MSGQVIEPERIARARQQYQRCQLCEHRCGVDRTAGQRGSCQAGTEARVYRQRVECGEEIELIPSHLFYLSGCNLRCVFCIAEEDAFDPQRGQPLNGPWLTETLAGGRLQGARNLQWVGGEPTVHLAAILEAMAGCGPLPPIVWKSNFFGTTEAFALLEGVVDVYVADFKFGNNGCARQLGGVDRYWETVTRNLPLAAGRGRLMVRHLLLPGHFDCCYRPVVDWLSRNLPAVPLRILAGYLPRWRAARYKGLGVPLDRQVALQADALAAEKGLNVIA